MVKYKTNEQISIIKCCSRFIRSFVLSLVRSLCSSFVIIIKCLYNLLCVSQPKEYTRTICALVSNPSIIIPYYPHFAVRPLLHPLLLLLLLLFCFILLCFFISMNKIYQAQHCDTKYTAGSKCYYSLLVYYYVEVYLSAISCSLPLKHTHTQPRIK